MANEENLPIPRNEYLSELGIVVPPPIILSSTSDLDETKHADIQLFNASLRVLYAMWSEVKTFNSALSMIDKTMTLIEKRRAILGLPYGSPQNKGSQTTTWEPLP